MELLSYEEIQELIAQRLSEKTRSLQITETPDICILDDFKALEQYEILRPDIQRLCDDGFIRESVGGTLIRKKYVAPMNLTQTA